MGLFSKKPQEPEYDAVDCGRKKKKNVGRFLTKRSKMGILMKFCMLICQLQNLKEVLYLIGILLRFSVTSLDSGKAISV